MPQKDMPKEVSIMGGCPVPSMCTQLLILAEVEAEGKAKAPRLRAQQKRLAKGKKGRFGAAMCHLWDKAKVEGEWTDFFPSRRSHSGRKVHRATQPGRPTRKGESSDSLRSVSPAQKAR